MYGSMTCLQMDLVWMISSSPVAENDIPDIIERFEHLDQEADRKRTDKSFLVPKQDIVDNDYDLGINKYKEIEYVPVEYPPTSRDYRPISARLRWRLEKRWKSWRSCWDCRENVDLK